jgi:UDP-N-acetylmuramate--alanine ligase
MKIHMIGIGGIGMSALARYYLGEGHSVTGSNNEESDLINSLRSEGISISVGEHDEMNVSDETDLVVYTIAMVCQHLLDIILVKGTL